MRTRHYLTVLSGSSTYSARIHRCIPYIQRMSLQPSVFCWQRDVHARSGGRRINEPLLYMHHDSSNTSFFPFLFWAEAERTISCFDDQFLAFLRRKKMLEYKTVQELWGSLVKCMYVCVCARACACYILGMTMVMSLWGVKDIFGGPHNFKGLFEVNTRF